MYAIFDRETGHLCFSGTIADGFRGRWQPGVRLTPFPPALRDVADGPDRPQRVVGVSLSDRSRYRVFSNASELVGSGFRSTGLAYGGTFERYPPPVGADGSQATGGGVPRVPTPPHGSDGPSTAFRAIVAEHEEEFVRAACRAEGFDAPRTEQIVAVHLSDPARLDLAERSWDGVAQYVRRLAHEHAGDAGHDKVPAGPDE